MSTPPLLGRKESYEIPSHNKKMKTKKKNGLQLKKDFFLLILEVDLTY